MLKNNLRENAPYHKLKEVLDLINQIKENYKLDVAFDNTRTNYYCVVIKLGGKTYYHPHNTYQGVLETLKLLIEIMEVQTSIINNAITCIKDNICGGAISNANEVLKILEERELIKK